MAKRRSKPVAEHVEATQATEPTIQPDTVDPVASAPLQEPVAHAAPDVFDQAIAAQQAGKFEQPDTNTRVEEALASGGVVRGSEVTAPVEHREPEANQEQRRPSDPKPIDTITLGDTNDAPKMRLFRNQRFNQMAIAFEESPIRSTSSSFVTKATGSGTAAGRSNSATRRSGRGMQTLNAFFIRSRIPSARTRVWSWSRRSVWGQRNGAPANFAGGT